MAHQLEQTRIARRYAAALYSAIEMKGEEAINKAISTCKVLIILVKNSESLKRHLASPVADISSIKTALIRCLRGMQLKSRIWEQLIGLLVQKNRLSLLLNILKVYEELHYAKQNILQVKLTSAQLLTHQEQESFTAALEILSGQKIILKALENPEFIAGVKIQMGSKMYDTSMRTQLNQLENAMKEVS